MQDITIADLLASVQLETGVHHVLRVHFPSLHVRLPIDPEQAEHWDDQFILTVHRQGPGLSPIANVARAPRIGPNYDSADRRLRSGATATLTLLARQNHYYLRNPSSIGGDERE